MNEDDLTSASGVNKTAAQLVTFAVLLLPKSERSRYLEENFSELDGRSGLDQVVHSLRVICLSWSLRRELLTDTAEDPRNDRRSRLQFLTPLLGTAAVVVIAFAGVSLAAREAQPGDPAWKLTRVLYPDYSNSVEAAAEVSADLDAARSALREGKVNEGKDALEKAGVALPGVSADDGHVDLASKHDQLSEEMRLAVSMRW